jgi:proline-rich protein PRCC
MPLVDYGSESEGEDSPPPFDSSNAAPSTLKPADGQAKPKKAPKKIAIDLPALSKDTGADDDPDGQRPAKRARMETKGAGSSALFNMLPAPKVKNPTPAAAPRVLGGGGKPGLVFTTTSALSSTAAADDEGQLAETGSSFKDLPSTLFAPLSLAKGKANISLEEGDIHISKPSISRPPKLAAPPADFFSLGESPYHITLPQLTRL